MFFFQHRQITNLANWKLSNEFDQVGKFLPKTFNKEKGTPQHFLYSTMGNKLDKYPNIFIPQVNYIFYRGIVLTKTPSSSADILEYTKKPIMKKYMRKLFMLWQMIVNPNFRYTIRGYSVVYYRWKSRILMFALQLSYVLGKRYVDTDPYLKEIEQIEKETGKPFYPVRQSTNDGLTIGGYWTEADRNHELRRVSINELLRRINSSK